MTPAQKSEIVNLIGIEKERLGSNAKVARKCGISEGTISQMVNKNWDLIADTMWQKVANELGYRPQGWQIVETRTMRSMWSILQNAKRESMFLALTDDAGFGKSTGLKAYASQHYNESVFYVECREWAKREFLMNLARTLGAEVSDSTTNDSLLLSISAFFNARRNQRPLLILDQANSLKAAALRTLITLFNQCEDVLGVVIAGTPHLEKLMMADARRDRPGGKELLSRFGRRMLRLMAANENDVKAICEANGVTNTTTIRKIFKECEPVSRIVGNHTEMVVEDLRRVKRCVQRELLILAQTAAKQEPVEEAEV